MCLSHHRRPKLCGSSWGLHHFYSCFCQKMDFRAFFVYFHTFSYNFKVPTNFHRNWATCGLTEVSVKIGWTLQSFLTEYFFLMIQMIHCQDENKAGSVFGFFFGITGAQLKRGSQFPSVAIPLLPGHRKKETHLYFHML